MLFTLKKSLRDSVAAARSTLSWIRAGYAEPHPTYMKRAALLRNAIPGSVFVETGTYQGATSLYFRKRGFPVVTIEVHRPLYERFSPYLRSQGVDPRLGDSADLLGGILAEHAGASAITVFLDGHYSAGDTGKGAEEVPVVAEFDALAAFLNSHPRVDCNVIVDDIRLFMPGGDPAYPRRASLVEFADRVGGDWKFEADMFICRRRPA